MKLSVKPATSIHSYNDYRIASVPMQWVVGCMPLLICLVDSSEAVWHRAADLFLFYARRSRSHYHTTK